MQRAPLPFVVIGALCAVGASFAFTLNDMAVKAMSDRYALHQIILIRSLFSLALYAVVIVPLSGGLRILRTSQLKMHVLRAGMIITANMMFFLALSAMPIADATAIFFAAPLILTGFSVVFLHETVGPRRWLAVGVGLVGTMVIIRPGSDSFTPVALLPLVAAAAYAGLHIMTRVIGRKEGAVTMAFYVQVTFLAFSAAFGLVASDGRFEPVDGTVTRFLFRAWIWPDMSDFIYFLLAGAGTALGGLMIAQAYRICQAAVIAPLEYAAMPMAIFWGVAVFHEWPDRYSWVGMGLIISAGMFTIFRETRRNEK